MTAKIFLAPLVTAMVALSSFALEVQDLHLPLKRSEADNTLTKDYSYDILTDGTIRRTWHISNRVVTVDFDPAEDTAICMMITYVKPVSRKTAETDANALAPDADVKWKKTKPDAVRKVGIPAGSLIREFDDRSMMFLEAGNSKNKYAAVSYFAKAPHKDRRTLEPIAGEHRTAMGSSSMAGDVKFLIRDEEARLKAKPAQSAKPALAATEDRADAAPSVASQQTVEHPVAADNTRPDASPATKPQPTKSAAKPAAKTITVVKTVVVEEPSEASGGFAQAAGDEDREYENLLDVIKAKATPVHLCIGAAVILVLLFLICAGSARSRARKRQKSRFTQVLQSSPTKAKPIVKK